MDQEKSENEGLKSQIKTASDYAFYAMQRIDLLVISVAGAGIYACWEVYKFFLTLVAGGVRISLIPLKVSAVLFLSTIILNFIGQWTSYKANVSRETSLEHQLSEKEHNSPDGHKPTIDKAERENKFYNTAVKISNGASLIALFMGLLFFAVFICHFL